jgi:hypothetical protein
MSAFTSAVDMLFADSNIGEDALWKAGGIGAGVAVRIIRKSPDRMAEFGDSRLSASISGARRRQRSPRAI